MKHVPVLLLMTLVCFLPLRAQRRQIMTAEDARAASALELATAVRGMRGVLAHIRWAEQGATVHLGDVTITRDNAPQFKAEMVERLGFAYDEIRRRGSRNLAGAYRGKATAACERVPAAWARGVRSGDIADVTITQDSFDVHLLHPITYQGRSDTVDVPAIVVDSVIAFVDVQNGDFVFLGQVDRGTITIGPDADTILRGWSEMAGRPPQRKDLTSCIVTLDRKKP